MFWVSKIKRVNEFSKKFLNLHHFLFFQEECSLEKRLESFDPLDYFYFFEPKQQYLKSVLKIVEGYYRKSIEFLKL